MKEGCESSSPPMIMIPFNFTLPVNLQKKQRGNTNVNCSVLISTLQQFALDRPKYM